MEFFVSNSSNYTEGIAVKWNYGLGKIYFISDFSSVFGSTLGKNVFNVLGWPLEYGLQPSETSQFVFPVTRFSFVEGGKKIPVSITLVLWRG